MDDRFSKSKYRVPSRRHNTVSRRGTGRKERLSGTLVTIDTAFLYDPTEDNDTTYRDAILDSSLRQYIKTEYCSVEPPPGVLARVQRAIEQDPPEAMRPAPRWVWVLQSSLLVLRNAMRKQFMGKLLPSGIAVVIALGIFMTATTSDPMNYSSGLWEQVEQTVEPGSSAQLLAVGPTQAPQTAQAASISGPVTVDPQAGDYGVLYVSGSGEVDEYDLHNPPKRPGDIYRTRKGATLGR